MYPSSQKDREKRLDDLLDVICADGRVEAPERQMILRYATLLGGVPADLNARIRARLSNQQKKQPAHEPAPRTEPTRVERPRMPERPPPPVQMSNPPEIKAAGSPALDFTPGPVELGGAQL